MRRAAYRRLFAAALLVASVLVPMAVTPAAAVDTAAVDTAPVHTAAVDRYDKADPHDKGECAPGGLGRPLTARLDRAVADVRREAGIPGVAVGLWMPGKGCYVRATGVADTATRRRMTTDQFMRIGSETKTFTVTALLELVDDRRIRLDDPISRHVRGVPNGDRITLRHLAEMRSGLFPYSADPDFVRALSSDPSRSFAPRELLAYAFRHPNAFAPGEEFQYSNTNLVLLGLGAGAIVSDLHGLRRWARIVATGTLLSPQTRRERLRMLPTGFPGTGYWCCCSTPTSPTTARSRPRSSPARSRRSSPQQRLRPPGTPVLTDMSRMGAWVDAGRIPARHDADVEAT